MGGSAKIPGGQFEPPPSITKQRPAPPPFRCCTRTHNALWQVMVQQYLKEQSQSGAPSLESKYYSKFLQALAELFVSVHYAQQAWGVGRLPERREANWALYGQATHRRVEAEDGQVPPPPPRAPQ